MESDNRRCLVFEGPAEAIDEIALLDVEGLRSSGGRALDSGTNVLDSPLSADQITEVVKTISLIITTTTAGLKLIDAIIAMKNKLGKRKIVVRDFESGDIKGAIGEDCSEGDVQRVIGE